MPLWVAAASLFVVNVPFGYWRGNVRRLSVQWVMAIHIPVLMAVALRLVSHPPLEPTTMALTVAAFFAGQTAGQGIRGPLASLLPAPPTSCLPMDLARALLDKVLF